MPSKTIDPRIAHMIPLPFPPTYAQVCRMAKAKKVSNAWIIRDAVEKYIQADTPLLAVKESR